MRPFAKVIAIGTSANLFGQLVTILIQVISLPLFLHYWDATQYGQWLMLYAVPSFLLVSDVGLSWVSQNEMTMLVAKGRLGEANAVFQTAVGFVTTICGLFASITVASVFVIDRFGGVESQDLFATSVLVFVVLGNVFATLFGAVCRASGHYAAGVYALNLARLIEWCGGAIGLVIGQSFDAVALGMLIARILSNLGLFVFTRSLCEEFEWGFSLFSFERLRKLIVPALTSQGFAVGQQISIQGANLAVGAVFGAAYLAQFSALRTMSRFSLQASTAIASAAGPEMATLFVSEKRDDLRRLSRWLCSATVGVSAVVSGLLLVLGEQLLRAWSRADIAYNSFLFIGFSVCAVIGAASLAPQMLILSTNRHGFVSLCYLIITSGAILFISTMTKGDSFYLVVFVIVVSELLMTALFFSIRRRYFGF